MDGFKGFIKTTILGGLVVVLPVAVLATVFAWVYGFVSRAIRPITALVLARSNMGEFVADLMVIAVIVAFCFVVGLIIRTRVGRFVHGQLEDRILKIAPGYSLIKETAMQFLGKRKSPFSSVALVQLFQNDTLVTAFVTDEHPDGTCTCFVPTGPNPTSGNIYHVKSQYVHPADVSVEETMRSIISCGAGSGAILGQREDEGGA